MVATEVDTGSISMLKKVGWAAFLSGRGPPPGEPEASVERYSYARHHLSTVVYIRYG